MRLWVVTCLLVIAACGANGGNADGESREAVEAVDNSIEATVVTEQVAAAATSSAPVLSVEAAEPTTTAASGATTASAAPTTETTAPTSSTVTEPATTATTATTADTVTTPTTSSEPAGSSQVVPLRFESLVDDVAVEDLANEALTILNDERGWIRAGFTFVADPEAPYRVVLAEGPTVDELCLPLRTGGTVSCQNGPVVALNADRWRVAVDHWVLGVEVYRGYLVNHEVGHLIGQRHPTPRCPIAGRPAGVMEQQTGGLRGCVGNPWPRDWEIEHAAKRPVVYAPLPAWGPDPVPANTES